MADKMILSVAGVTLFRYACFGLNLSGVLRG
jgi:hypothetical protein